MLAHGCDPRDPRGALVCDLRVFSESVDGLREAFGTRPFRQEGPPRRAQPSGGYFIAAEWFQRIANLAFHAALFERQQDQP
jgi:hypothetical protein